jgi:(1->4)-alpha-D-glucan 1-alpha-D-glucosylmutase
MSKAPFSFIYRLQVNADFPLKKVKSLIPYLKKLGVDGLYLSPVFLSRSSHGYDVLNPNQLNPKIGTEKEWNELSQKLEEEGMGLLLDIVPNHMGIGGGQNPWWQDVLRLGSQSSFASFFDINWESPFPGKVLLPILGAPYGEILKSKKIKLHTDHLSIEGYQLPLCPESLPVKKEIVTSIEKMHALLEMQHYRLTYWKCVNHELNYRRFFNIHELVGVRMEDPHVFETCHQKILQWVKEKKVQALRIDHPDGLYDPTAYFKKLKEKSKLPLLVEKILEPGEELPSNWDVEGTVGYEALHHFDALFVKQESEEAFTALYSSFSGECRDLNQILYSAKKDFAQKYMASEVESLGKRLNRLTKKEIDLRDFSLQDLTETILEVVASFPVYRTYLSLQGKVSARDRLYIEEAVESAKQRAPHLDQRLFLFLRALLLGEFSSENEWRDWVCRFQQLTGPMMAKGLEDTAFYQYNRLLSLNEVGGDPSRFGISLEEFHVFLARKQKMEPLGLITSSTHDTKRSLDARMRLHMLSEIPKKWEKCINKWRKLTLPFKQKWAPTGNDEYMFYQTLCAVLPLKRFSKKEASRWVERLWVVLMKCLREGKQSSCWNTPNLHYEERFHTFLKQCLISSNLMDSLYELLEEIAPAAQQSTLSYLALQFGAPGIVDLYQGGEIENLRLVDPDNREQVDFSFRKKLLGKDQKQQLIQMFGQFRAQHSDLMIEGEYLPIASPNHVIAFARHFKKKRLLVIARRFFFDQKLKGELILPKAFISYPLRDLKTGEEFCFEKENVGVKELLKEHSYRWIYCEN